MSPNTKIGTKQVLIGHKTDTYASCRRTKILALMLTECQILINALYTMRYMRINRITYCAHAYFQLLAPNFPRFERGFCTTDERFHDLSEYSSPNLSPSLPHPVSSPVPLSPRPTGMSKPRSHHRPHHRHKHQSADYTALLSRLAALEATLIKQSGSRGLAEAPASLVRLSADLFAETRAHLPGSVRKRRLPRIHANSAVSLAELSVIAGQARAALAAYISARGLDRPSAAPDPRIDTMRKKLAARLEVIIAERVAERVAKATGQKMDTDGRGQSAFLASPDEGTGETPSS